MAGSDKIERLFNLVSLLLDTRRPLSVKDIREKIPSYADHTDDAFHRMFERDKNDIRDLGFVIEQEDIDAWGETGYRIRRQEAMLDDPGVAPDEMAALSLAAQARGRAASRRRRRSAGSPTVPGKGKRMALRAWPSLPTPHGGPSGERAHSGSRSERTAGSRSRCRSPTWIRSRDGSPGSQPLRLRSSRPSFAPRSSHGCNPSLPGEHAMPAERTTERLKRISSWFHG